MQLRAKPCKYCGELTHFPFQCFKNPKGRKKYTLRPGKQAKMWQTTRRQWFWENQAEYYVCYICGRSMTPAETTLDHIKSRGRHPELRNELSNLAPCCFTCNKKKGSRDLEEIEYGRN